MTEAKVILVTGGLGYIGSHTVVELLTFFHLIEITLTRRFTCCYFDKMRNIQTKNIYPKIKSKMSIT